MMLKILENFKEKFNIIFIPYIIYFYGITIVFSLLYMVLFSILFDSYYYDLIFFSIIGIGVFLYFKFRNRVRIFDLYMLYRNNSKFSAKWIVLALIIITTIIPTTYNIYFFKRSYYGISNVTDISKINNFDKDKYLKIENYKINKNKIYLQRVKKIETKNYGRGSGIINLLTGTKYDVELSVHFLFEIINDKSINNSNPHKIFLLVKKYEQDSRVYESKDENQEEELYFKQEIGNILNYEFDKIKYFELIDKSQIEDQLYEQLPIHNRNNIQVKFYTPVFDDFNEEIEDKLFVFAKMMIFFPLIVLYVLIWIKIDKEDYQKYINGERITITSRFQKFWNGEYDDLKEENQ